MKSYAKIASETGTTVGDVRCAMDYAEHFGEISYSFFDGSRWRRDVRREECWIVNNEYAAGYADDDYRYCHRDGIGRTREEAVVDALRNGFRA